MHFPPAAGMRTSAAADGLLRKTKFPAVRLQLILLMNADTAGAGFDPDDGAAAVDFSGDMVVVEGSVNG